jgi:diacylglycerol kinase family enzyme
MSESNAGAARRVAVLLNAGAGSLAPGGSLGVAARLETGFAMEGIAASVALVPAGGVAGAAREAAARGVFAVVVGGGDGTLGAAAEALAGGTTPLAALPLGTLNHFARDLGMPRELDAAVRAIARGRVRAVDVGEIGGRVFLNNASVGLYPEMVGEREERRRLDGHGKWRAMAHALVAVLRRFPLLTVRLEAAGAPLLLRTPFVFVGNNPYDFSLLSLGRRERLDGGTLGLYVARRATRFALLRLALLALVGRLEQDRDFEARQVASLELATPRPRLRVALDGELAWLTPPLACRTRPAALRVLAPPFP